MGLKCLVSRKQQSRSEVLTRRLFSTLIVPDPFHPSAQGQNLSDSPPSFVDGASNPPWFWTGKNRRKQRPVSQETPEELNGEPENPSNTAEHMEHAESVGELNGEPENPSNTAEHMEHAGSVQEGNGNSDESLPEIANPPEYVVPRRFYKYANGEGSQGR